MMELSKAVTIAASAMRAQGTRMRVISENLANANSTATEPGGDPYRRQLISFKGEIDKSTGAMQLAVDKIVRDQAEFVVEYEPNHPAANEAGYVKRSNVNTLVELIDMKEAQRSYEANVSVIDVTKSMVKRTVDLLKS